MVVFCGLEIELIAKGKLKIARLCMMYSLMIC